MKPEYILLLWIFQPRVHLFNSSAAAVASLKKSSDALSNCETGKSVGFSLPFEISFIDPVFHRCVSHTSLLVLFILGLFC